MILRHLMHCVVATLLIPSSPLVLADEQKSATTVAQWEYNENKWDLIIDVSDLLSPAQKEIVNSGFSTFTIFTISDRKISPGDPAADHRIICSVKYDTWEERYQIIRVEPPPLESRIIKTYKEWAKECLRLELDDRSTVAKYKASGHLNALLQIRQSSPEEASKIKNWLVRQQSGFMQGLYSHMLGDFQFRDTINVRIKIPSTESGDKKDSGQQPATKKDL